MRKRSSIRIPADNAELKLYPDFLKEADADSLFGQLLKETPWHQDLIKLYGKTMPIPRLQAWYGDRNCHYRYSGIDLEPQPWTSTLQNIRSSVEALCQHELNSVLLNQYRHGQDSNGWHSDNEPELGENPVIASLSLGEIRRFRLRHRYNKELEPISLDLPSGSLLIMAGETQKYWQHCITKTRRTVGARINLTFRKLVS